MTLHVVPCFLDEANEFVKRHHRHHQPLAIHVFSLAVATDEGEVVGVLIAARPAARHYVDGFTLEVARSCTDGYRNANSMLYRAAIRAAWALGYRRLITYTLEGESGASLRAVGMKVVAQRAPRPNGWNRAGRPRVVREHDALAKTLWEITA
jgi:L-amino acid N-acyltransferase YncA